MTQNQPTHPASNAGPQQPAAPPTGAPSYIPPQRAARAGRLKKPEGWSSIISTVAVLLIAPLIALFLTAFVFQSYQVDGPSMETTLYNNDRLLVWKIPKTWSRITGNSYIPNRGDVVIFVEHSAASLGEGSDKQLIKRVLALPGERIVVKDGVVKVYNDEHPDGFQPDRALPYGELVATSARPDDEVDQVVPKGTVYVMGDNRLNSMDSRAFGPVESKDIVGKLVMRVWPISDVKAF
jgi:signal peptidase I